MKIAFVIDRTEPFYRGGYERRAWELATRLARSHDVTVFTSAPSDQVLSNVTIRAVRGAVPYFKESGFRDLKANLAFSLALLPYLTGRERFDIVDCNATPFLHIFPTALLARRWRAALVVTAHEALAGTMEGYFQARRQALPRTRARLARMIYFAGQRMCDQLIAASSVTAAELRLEGFRSVETCAGGITRCFAPKSTSARRIVFVGRLVRNKRVDVLLRAFALAQGRGALDSLTIVGDGPERARLETLAVELGVADWVKFTGEVDDARKTDILLNESDFFASASVREGICISALEAMAAGHPVVICHQPGLSQNGATEYVADGGNGLITSGSIESLAAAFTRIVHDPDLFRKMSREAVHTASRYTWDVVAAQLETIYRRIESTRTSRPHTQKQRPAAKVASE